MKRFLASAVAMLMIIAVFAATAIATDPVCVYSYDLEEEAAVLSGQADIFDYMAWSDTEGKVNPSFRAVIFNAAVGFTGFGMPVQWNSSGQPNSKPKVTYDFELFNFNTNYNTSVKGTPVFKETVQPDGDLADGVYFDFGKTVPKGKYVARFNITSSDGYTVFPKYTCLYPKNDVVFEPDGKPFGFYIDFVEKANTYFLNDNGEPVFPGNSISSVPDSIGTWLCSDKKPDIGACAESVYVKFTTAGSFNGMRVRYWASNPDITGPAADWIIEIFKFNKNVDKTFEGDPVYTEKIHSIADDKPKCDFGFNTMKAGTYVIRITIENPEDTMVINGKTEYAYVVLPRLVNDYSQATIRVDYDEDKFDYGDGEAFKLMIFGESVNGEFFIDNPDEDYSLDPVTSEEESETDPETSETDSGTETETETDGGSDSESVSESETVTEPESNKEEGSVTETEEDSKETESPVKVEAKDVNGDGEANNKDVVDLFRYVSKGEAKYDPKYDIDGSNEINNKDVVALFRALSEV